MSTTPASTGAPGATDTQRSTSLGATAVPAPALATTPPVQLPAKSLIRKSTLSLKQSVFGTLSGALVALSACGTTAAGLVSLLHSSQASADLLIGGAALTLVTFFIHQLTQDVPGL